MGFINDDDVVCIREVRPVGDGMNVCYLRETE